MEILYCATLMWGLLAAVSALADLAHIWSGITKGNRVVVLCDGLNTKSSSIATSNRGRQTRDSDGHETDEGV